MLLIIISCGIIADSDIELVQKYVAIGEVTTIEKAINTIAGIEGNVTWVKFIPEKEAGIPNGAPDNVVRIVTENGRTLKFDNQGFEEE